METTLAILLYLNIICSGSVDYNANGYCTYERTEINAIIEQSKPRIQEVKNDPAKTKEIEIKYGPQVTNIVIIDPDIE